MKQFIFMIILIFLFMWVAERCEDTPIFSNDSTKKSNSNKIETKQIKEYYSNGNVKLSCTTVNGMLHGTCYTYYENGTPFNITEMKYDKQHGLFLQYYENGKLSLRQYYSNGVLNGDFNVFHENGNIALKGFYKDGKKTGKWKFYKFDGSFDYEEKY